MDCIVCLIILLIFYCFIKKDEFVSLKRDMYNYPAYSLPMPDQYSYGNLFYLNNPAISYKPGFW